MPGKIVEKFGRVFIKKVGSSDYEPLKSASFSNLDLKWYDVCGEVHPLYHKHTGKKFTMGFSINNINSEGVYENFHSRLLVPLGLGEISGPDMEYLDLAAKTEWDLARKFELISGEDGDEMTELFRKYQGASGFIVPGRRLLLKSPFLGYISIINVWDDMMDDMGEGVAEACRKMRYKQAKGFLQGAINVLHGKGDGSRGNSPDWDDIDFAQMFQLPNIGLHAMLQFRRMYRCLSEMTQSVREEALKFGTEQEAKYFLDSAVEGIEAGVLEISMEWCGKDKKLFKTAQVDLKKAVSGMNVGLEGLALQLGIRLSDEIRSSWLFKWYREEIANSGGKLNDLMSYNKEMLLNQAEQNQVYTLHVQEKLPLNEALQTVLEEANRSVLTILECGNMLMEMFENDKELGEFVEMVKEIICAGFAGLAHTSRYHSNVVFDCYFDENVE